MLAIRVGPRAEAGTLSPVEELKPTPIAPAIRTSRRDAHAEREMAEFQRRVDAAGPNADIELIVTNLRAELGYTPWWERVAV